VFEHVGRPGIEPVVQGISGTVFAYGVTSSGKTHTMMGTAADPGVVPRAIAALFDQIGQATDRCVPQDHAHAVQQLRFVLLVEGSRRSMAPQRQHVSCLLLDWLLLQCCLNVEQQVLKRCAMLLQPHSTLQQKLMPPVAAVTAAASSLLQGVHCDVLHDGDLL
jgi:hypothetical protein